MKYLRNTRDITLTMEAGDGPKWWVDSSYVLHPDMRSHSGIFMTLGKYTGYVASNKQKINTKSSTEAELLAIDDSMGQILWTRHFLAAQGEQIPTTTIYQDNKSTILLAENGRKSSSKSTKHLDVRYVFMMDKIKKGKVKITHCPTQDMLGDFFTKPLQGTQFARLRSKILNLPSGSSTAVHRSVLENDKTRGRRNDKTRGRRNDKTRGEGAKEERLNIRLRKEKAFIGGRDGNSKL